MRKQLTFEDSAQDVFVKMGEGNPGGLRVLIDIVKSGKSGNMDFADFEPVYVLADMNMRGEQVWVGYKYHCGEDLARFMECIARRDQAMIDKVNEMCVRADTTEFATPGGANSPAINAVLLAVSQCGDVGGLVHLDENM